jgi:hypothetical protein
VFSRSLESRRASHEWHSADPPTHARKENRSGCPRNDFLEGVATLVSAFFDHPYAPNDFRASPLLPKLAQWKTVWTLPSLWTHRTRPQGTWKTAQTAVFHSAHTDRVFLTKKKRNNEEHCKCANPIVSTEGFTPGNCAPNCALTSVYARRRPSLTGKHGQTSFRSQGVEAAVEKVFRYRSTSLQRLAFQACLIDRSSISPFRIKHLRDSESSRQ